MKKSTILLICTIGLLLILVGCASDKNNDSTSPSSNHNPTTNGIYETSSDTETIVDTTTQSNNSTESSPSQPQPIGGGDDGLAGMKADTYRYNYYRVTSDYIDIVGAEAYYEWLNANPNLKTKELDEMLMVSYIKHFNITREQFDEASKKRLELFEEFNMEPNFPPYQYEDNYDFEKELYEIYNADIIYTFDNELINEYYARPPELIIENGTNALGETVE